MSGEPPVDPDDAQAAEPTSCAVCGTVVQQRPLTWSLQVGARGAQWLCETCTRLNVRSIEGRLDEAWW